MNLIKFLDNNPTISSYISLGSIITGQAITSTETHIPPVVMESVQLLVWIVGILAGVITIHGWVKKYLVEKKTKKKK